MARFYPTSGGGGADVSIVTAEADDVLAPKVIVDANGDPVAGTLSLTGDATPEDVVKGKTFYNTDAKNVLAGTQPVVGSVTKTLGAGESYTISKGIHDGTGTITVKTLAELTADGTITSTAQILSGYKAYSDGVLYQGTMPNQGARTATYTPTKTVQTYTIPAGHHNGNGKVTIDAIPSKYVDVSGGLTFFKDGVFGDWVYNLGIGNVYPLINGSNNVVNNGNGTYTPLRWGGQMTEIDPDTLSTGSLHNNIRLAYNSDNNNANSGRYWGTRKTIDFTYFTSWYMNTYSGGSSSDITVWIYNVEKDIYWRWTRDGSHCDGDLDISVCYGPCVFGMSMAYSSGNGQYECSEITLK